jgi:hypothetical protein
MRKLSAILSAVPTYLFLAPAALAITTCPPNDPLCANVAAPNGRIIAPTTAIGSIVSFGVAFIIVIAFLAALLFIVLGAFQWITSGGDKQKVADARNHIIAAVIGLIVIALSFVIINVVISALGLGSLTNISIPRLSEFQ